MSGVPDVPPWEPIADWLARMNDDNQQGTMSQNERREEYEQPAKAIAYDIATHGIERFDPVEIQQDLRKETSRPPFKVCSSCEGHGGVVGDCCERCQGTGRVDGGNI